MNDRTAEKRKRPAISGVDPARAPAQENEDESPRSKLCAFCLEHPSGPSGHAGFAQQAHKIPVSDRSYVRLACVFCGTAWVRRRLSAKSYEWLRLAD
ncbi:hypothetical protein [Undibacterium sp.]|jgi:hypothetical protein|uniref:hypothetical protein n=1 Tax=Undibacterium sp. TaxID=1914977 RepID=UPI002CEA6B07|nr:hypothetical protein [Undibacterium sp.]HTD03377.1 hypothetical protein [Undibacterium sp.]